MFICDLITLYCFNKNFSNVSYKTYYKVAVVLRLRIFKLIFFKLVVNLIEIVYLLCIFLTYYFNSKKCREALETSKYFVTEEYKNFVNFLKKVLFIILNYKFYLRYTFRVISSTLLSVLRFIKFIFLSIVNVFYYICSVRFIFDVYTLILFSYTYLLLFNIYMYLFLVELVCFVITGVVFLRVFFFIFCALFSVFGIYLNFKLDRIVFFCWFLDGFVEFLIEGVWFDITHEAWPKLGGFITQVCYNCEYLDERSRCLSPEVQEFWNEVWFLWGEDILRYFSLVWTWGYVEHFWTFVYWWLFN